jgi:hypothetical protein
VVREGRPWLLIETKLTDSTVEGHHMAAAAALGGVPVVQVCREAGVATMQGKGVYRISAERFFA